LIVYAIRLSRVVLVTVLFKKITVLIEISMIDLELIEFGVW